jgi:hypothetical protein
MITTVVYEHDWENQVSIKRNTIGGILATLVFVGSTASALEFDKYGRPIEKEKQTSTPDPVTHKMKERSWIHTKDKDPVKHKMRERSWIHTEHKDPVKYEMQKDSWIHGSIHDD